MPESWIYVRQGGREFLSPSLEHAREHYPEADYLGLVNLYTQEDAERVGTRTTTL